MTETINFVKGAFAVYEPGREPGDATAMARFIPFRFNPEGLQRQLALEQAQGAASAGGAGATSDAAGEQSADAASGTLKESFSILLRFDLAEREDPGSTMPVEFGVLPEIAALEDLLHPVESDADAPSDDSTPVRPRGQLPLVLMVWGERRVVPVRITGMTINESLFNGRLYPVRAEVEVSLEVLGEAEARDNTRVRASLDFTAANRRKMARIYLDSTADQGTNVNLPQ